MIKSICIDNYALIEQLEIDLGSGLTIITGETGAGKSIFLGALGLLLGKRADTSVLRSQNRKCVVEGTFALEGYGLQDYFEQNEVDYDAETLIRREITPAGKSRAFINDTPVNLNQLRDLSLQLVDIHSQHENLLLNSDAYLRWIIDSYAGNKDELLAFQNAYQQFIRARTVFLEKEAAYRTDKDNLDLLNHQYSELSEANLKENELNELTALSSLLGNAEEIRISLEGALQAVSEEETGIISDLSRALDYLKRIRKHDARAEELLQRMESCFIEMKDIQTDLMNHTASVEIDPARLETVNMRIDRINSLLHKYRVGSEKELIEMRNRLDEKLQDLALSDDELDMLEKQLREKESKARELADKLSNLRTDVFGRFQEQIENLLRELGMKNAAFHIRHETREIDSSGIDNIQFFFSANKNVPPQNITRVASGGELSRLMLAIKYLISDVSGLPSILFDEIDTGVSGEIADKVGRLIKAMARSMQVINITHLPQVASKGDHHFIVFKEVQQHNTITRMRKLNKTDRLNEIARMLSGDSVTDAAVENAKVLLGY